MKRLITTIALALLVVPATFAGEQSLLARVTVYWANGAGSNHHQCATGLRLQTGDCSVDTRHIPYGSSVIFPDGTASVAVDTGPAVRNRKAARISGRTVYERNAIVIDRFFETKREALSWVSRNPLFMNVRVVPSNSRTTAQLREQPLIDALAQPVAVSP
jgi:3D (Asp-Asp-Asp) domain-containing protein